MLVTPLSYINVGPYFKVYLEFLMPLRLTVAIGWISFTVLLAIILLPLTVGPRSLRFLHRYFEILQMVSREGVCVCGGGGLLCRTLPWRVRRDTGVPTAAHHIEYGDRHSGPPLGITSGGNRWGRQQRRRRNTAGGQDD